APAGTVLGEMTTEYGLVAAPAGEARAQTPMRAITSATACLRGRRLSTVVPSTSREKLCVAVGTRDTANARRAGPAHGPQTSPNDRRARRVLRGPDERLVLLRA